MKPRFASDTSVPVERSRAELEKLVRNYGADQFASGWEDGRAMIQFRLNGRVVRLDVPMPTLAAVKKAHPRRAPGLALAQAERQRWRALVLLCKAKLESCALGLETFEQAFLASIVVKDGRTVGQHLIHQLENLERNTMPLLPGATT